MQGMRLALAPTGEITAVCIKFILPYDISQTKECVVFLMYRHLYINVNSCYVIVDT